MYIASYAYSKSIDLQEHRPNSEFGGTSPQDNSNIRASLAPSGFDQTHVFNMGYSYQIPFGGLRGPAKLVLGGWQTTGIWTFETGRPFNQKVPG